MAGRDSALFTLYDEDGMDDLGAEGKRAFRTELKTELERRR
jgi:hypothetical protein